MNKLTCVWPYLITVVYVSTTKRVSAVSPAKIKPCAHPPIQMTISTLFTNPRATHKIMEIAKQQDATGARPKRCMASPTDNMAKMHGIKPPRLAFHTEAL